MLLSPRHRMVVPGGSLSSQWAPVWASSAEGMACTSLIV